MQKEVVEGYRLSPQQRQLWLLSEQDDALAYNTQSRVAIEGNLRRVLFNSALEQVIARHEILRTTFQRMSGTTIPVQVIDDSVRPEFVEYDLSSCAQEEQDGRIEAICNGIGQKRFDFENGPLVHLSLLKLNPEAHMLVVTAAGLCADRGSIRNMVREINRCYKAIDKGEAVQEEPMQYADLAEWLNGMLEGKYAEASRHHWQSQDFSSLKDHKLPFEKRVVTGRETGERRKKPVIVADTFPTRTLKRIEEVADELGTTSSVFVLACWQILLWRLTQLPELIIASVCDGRNYGELEGALGLFAKCLPLKSALQANAPFSETLKSAADAVRDAYDYQEYFHKKQMIPDDDIGNFTWPFGYDFQEEYARFSDGGPIFRISKEECCIDRFKMKLSCIEREEGLLVELEYDEGKFYAGDVERVLEHFGTLVEGAGSEPESEIGRLPIVSGRQRRQLLEEYSRGPVEEEKAGFVHEMIERVARGYPEAVAVCDREQELSYKELDERANQLGHLLQRMGVGPEVVVGILVNRGVEVVVAMLAVLKAGGAYLALEASQPRTRQKALLGAAKVGVLISEEGLVEGVAREGERVVLVDGQQGEISAESRGAVIAEVSPENLVYVLFTSGSTGEPKAVEIEHRQLSNYVVGIRERLEMEPGMKHALVSTFGADLGNTVIYGSLCTGGRLEIVSQEEAWEAGKLTGYLRGKGIDWVKMVPSHLSAVQRAGEELKAEKGLILGGEELRWDCVERAGGSTIYNHYGPTETTVGVLTNKVGKERDQREESVPLGRPLRNTRVYVLEESWELAPPWVAGEIYISGGGVGRGYKEEGGATAERFVPDWVSGGAGERMYRSGDRGRYVRGGQIEYLGRKDEQLKIRGYRIEPGEVAAVVRGEGGVKECVVVSREGEGGQAQLVAYVEGEREEIGSVSEMRRRLRERMPEYMVPGAIVVMERLPLTPNGKIDRRRLPEPGEWDSYRDFPFVAPRYGLEFQLAQIWEDILNVRPIGISDSFFDLGGHSLLAMRIMAQIQTLFGKDLPLSILFEASTIERLAVKVREQGGLFSRSPLVRIQSGDGKQPFFCIHAVGGTVMCYLDLARHLGADQTFYAMQAPEVDEPLTNLEKIAAQYIEAMRSVQPEGPYMVGGWSFGAITAFEIAQQLQRDGQRVALLALMDRRAPVLSNAPARYDDDDVIFDPSNADDPIILAKLAKHMAGQYAMELPISFDYLRQLQPNDQYNYILEQAKSIKLLPQEFRVEQVLRLLRGYTGRRQAARDYVPSVYPGRITLLRAKEVKPELVELSQRDATLGWSQLSTEPVDIHLIPGSHATIVTEPNVQVMAERLGFCIDGAAANKHS